MNPKPPWMRTTTWRKVLAYAEEVRAEDHRAQTHSIDDDGYCHTRGGAYGNGDREAYGYTKKNAEKVRALAKADAKVTLGEAEGVLQAALFAIDGGLQYPVAMSAKERQAKRRASLPEGSCVVCGYEAREGLRTCATCNAASQERQRRARLQKRRHVA